MPKRMDTAVIHIWLKMDLKENTSITWVLIMKGEKTLVCGSQIQSVDGLF